MLELDQILQEHSNSLINMGYNLHEYVDNSQIEYIKYKKDNKFVILYPSYYELGYIDFKSDYFKVLESRYSDLLTFFNKLNLHSRVASHHDILR